MIVERYRDTDAAAWDAFVRASRNGTFLFERGYMDYHRDRFPDHSLVVRDAEGELVAVLPAHAAGDTVASHNGLSYGGLVIGPRMKTPLFFAAFEAVLLALRDAGFRRSTTRRSHTSTTASRPRTDRYALFLSAQFTRRDLLSVVHRWATGCRTSTAAPAGSRRRQAAGVTGRSRNRLRRVLGAAWRRPSPSGSMPTPVHTLAEIQTLRDRFPRASACTRPGGTGELLAGVVTYETERAAHAQYIAASPAGRDAAHWTSCSTNCSTTRARADVLRLRRVARGRRAGDQRGADRPEGGLRGPVGRPRPLSDRPARPSGPAS